MLSRRSWTVGAVLALAVGSDAQPAVRRATNIAAIVQFPGFYHLRPIVIIGKVATEPNGEIRVSDGGVSVRLITKGSAFDGLDEVRGEFWDIGRMKPDEPRLAEYDLKATFHVDPEGPWPRPGDVTAIVATTVAPASAPLTPSIRAIVLNPSRYLEQRVTITGQFSGRNLTGDLPDAPGKSRYDFVLRSADAAIWVSDIRPKGKDFDFALDSRLDTARWMQVSGTVQHGRGLQWIDADAGSLTLAKPPTESPAEEREVQVPVPAVPPPTVLFSAPAEDESDVLQGTSVRIQFSRDLDQATLKGHIRVSYLESQSVERGAPTLPSTDFAMRYNATNRVLELTFTKPLERFRTRAGGPARRDPGHRPAAAQAVDAHLRGSGSAESSAPAPALRSSLRAKRLNRFPDADDERVAIVEAEAGGLDRRTHADGDRDRPDEPAAPLHRRPAP